MRFVVKFIFDRVFSLFGLIFTFPFLILISILIWIDSGRPIFFLQERVGKHGRLFRIIKFRSMVVNKEVNTITTKRDPRITRVGAFLRKWKLDELPELFNVLAGDMSFVGPRPDVAGYADQLSGEDRKILLLRPGITGWATLKYLDEEELLSNVENPQDYNDQVIFPDKVKINRLYFEHFSFGTDLLILYHTLIRKKRVE